MNTLSRKIVMAATGLFLCLFLLIHCLGNTQLFLEPEQAKLSFNAYSHFMTTNPIVKIISYVLYLSIIGHVVYALIITLKNRKAGGLYKRDNRGRASKWYSRNMGLLGTIVLVFLVTHFANFWYIYRFGEFTAVDANGNKDLFLLVQETFTNLWIVILYVVAMIALCYHLIHGINSGVRSLGLFHPKFVRWINVIGIIYSVVLCVGFALMPLYMYFTQN
ncbi:MULTISPECIES: succinate dehydrogenase cytochrome b subunit [Myroides]|uniref:Succinate dehydrogenase n=1 Tax=Myroides albus TaxID=2562892 RepID=A0A6I3LN65_9FLAO|nr:MULTISPECIES: succinate dehydrogenase cytochrome b subunit [Myroides]MTG98750.1 succinate dehydrogenase [Myroides albus]MVX36615.1 succinate dehydrogenase [Myroides sp. LoEW2-1]UVD79932.1 succinate dehydrogenase cytochrome b subunit [Myroides albus]